MKNNSHLFKHVIEGTKSWLSWASIAMGILSFLSVLNRLLDVGLHGIVHDLIEIYRTTLQPVYSLIARIPLPIELSLFSIDCIILYLIFLSISYRAGYIVTKKVYLILYNQKIEISFEIYWKTLILLPIIRLVPLRYLLIIRERLQLVRNNPILVFKDMMQPTHTPNTQANEEIDSLISAEKLALSSIYQILSFPIAVILLLLLNRVWQSYL